MVKLNSRSSEPHKVAGPRVGMVVENGQPVIRVLAQGERSKHPSVARADDETRSKLQSAAALVMERLKADAVNPDTVEQLVRVAL